MRIAFASVVAALAVIVAAGCGGSSGSEDATVAWAGGVCSALTSWTSSVQSATTTLQDTSSLSAQSVTDAVQSVIDATTTLADDVKGLGKPDLDAADQAEQTVTELSDTLQTDADTLQKTLDESGGGVSGLLARVSTLSGTLTSMASAVGQAFSQLEQLDATGELEQAFKDADSCDSLTGSS
jgi:hypothetical protein